MAKVRKRRPKTVEEPSLPAAWSVAARHEDGIIDDIEKRS
jgi:hypothetical protein